MCSYTDLLVKILVQPGTLLHRKQRRQSLFICRKVLQDRLTNLHEIKLYISQRSVKRISIICTLSGCPDGQHLAPTLLLHITDGASLKCPDSNRLHQSLRQNLTLMWHANPTEHTTQKVHILELTRHVMHKKHAIKRKASRAVFFLREKFRFSKCLRVVVFVNS